MPTTEPIETDRLTLRPLEVNDAAEMVGVLSDAGLHRFTGGEPPTLDELRNRYRHQVAGPPRLDETWHNWVIRLDGRAVGFVQATVHGEHADLAWVVGVPWQGSGFASEAAGAMREWLSERGVSRFTAHIHPDHAASLAIARKLGMQPTGRVDEDGEAVWHRPGTPQPPS